MSSPPRTVLAIDPGSSKCGMALVRRDERGKLALLWRTIVPPSELCAKLKEAAEVCAFDMVILGSGTRSKDVQHTIRSYSPSLGILVVDERDTTLQARERYWEHNKRRGWRKFLPATLQTPPEPVDDFVAYILAERVLHS